MKFIDINEQSMPLETDIIVSHPYGVEAIRFFNHQCDFSAVVDIPAMTGQLKVKFLDLTDIAGNIQTPITLTLDDVDNVAPQIARLTWDNPYFAYERFDHATLNVSLYEPVTLRIASLDTCQLVIGDHVVALPLGSLPRLVSGEHGLMLTFTDKSGNSTVATLTLNVLTPIALTLTADRPYYVISDNLNAQITVVGNAKTTVTQTIDGKPLTEEGRDAIATLPMDTIS